MKVFDRAQMEALFKAAAENPRLRTNFNFHTELDDPVNRLCIAALPGSKFAIQRHPEKWEMLTVIYGSAISRLYDDAGRVTAEFELGTGKNFVIEIPANTWHNLEILEPCVFYEVKRGPYAPVAPEDNAPWQ